MRRIGTLPDANQAHRFCDFLQTKTIDAKASSHDESAPPATTEHDIWIRDERDVEQAREFFERYRSAPASSEYDVSAEAERMRKKRSDEIAKKLADQKKAQMRVRRVTGSTPGGGLSPLGSTSPATIPVTVAIIVLATLLGFITNFGQFIPNVDPAKRTDGEQVYEALSCVDYADLVFTGGDAFAGIKSGEVWRLFTPMLLHGSMMHLAFNMFNLYIIGSVVERLHGSLFYLMLLLLCQAVATSTQILLPDWLEGPRAIGASGAVFGVFGFVWIRPKVQFNYPVEIPSYSINFMLVFMVLCFPPLSLFGNIANGAHVGGLLTGMLLAKFLPPNFKMRH